MLGSASKFFLELRGSKPYRQSPICSSVEHHFTMTILVAESPASLLERMAKELAACRDPWARHWLVIAGSGRSEWLQRRWSRIAGVAARSQIVSLRSVIEQAATPTSQPFSRERLVLAVAQALPTLVGRTPLPKNAQCSLVDARVLSWAEQVADALDLALLCRDGDDRWGTSDFLEELSQHPSVKGALEGHIGTLTSNEFRLAAAHWLELWKQRGGAPKLWIQLDAGLPHVLFGCLAELLALMGAEVDLSLLSPSRAFWGDLRSGRRWADGQDAGPVLSCLGRQAQDLHNQAIDRFLSHGSGGDELPPLTAKDSLLGRLRDACCHAGAPDVRLELRDDDWSFTAHSCRSPLRELEICRDRILQAMDEAPTLSADDILVLLAEPSTYAPLVGAALAPLPVRVLGLGGAGGSPVASGLLRLLTSLNRRLGLTDLQALIEEPLIAERFGFQGNTEELMQWLEQAQFRWGLDVQQRAEVQGEGEARWNLAFALRRLGLGAVVSGNTRDGVVEGAAPLERACGLSTALLARLAQFATTLYEAREAWVSNGGSGTPRAARAMGEWCALLGQWCEQFLGYGLGTASEQMTQLVNALIPSLQAAAPAGLLLQSDAVLRLLEKQLELLSAGQGAGSGGITVAELGHYAGVPAKMVLVVGLGSSTFPRHEDRPGWHPLARSRKIGDPDRRDADRHALLLALLGCDERLVLTYQGGSDEDGKERPPSTPLADLLAAVDVVALRSSGETASSHVLIKHGLNGFSPAACATTTRRVARSYLTSDYAGAATLLERDRKDYPGLWSQVLPLSTHSQPLALRDLHDLFQEPCRIFVRRLGLRLPEEVEEPSQEDALTLDALGRWSLRDRMLHCRLTGDDPQALLARATASGELPRGRYGEELWDSTQTELPDVAEQGLLPLAETLQLTIGSRRLIATLPAGWYRNEQGSIVFCSASSRSKPKLLQVRLGLLCLSLAEDVGQIETWFKKEKKPKILVAPAREEAILRLAELCRLHQLAECLPLPFWPGSYEKMRELEDKTQRDPNAAITTEQLLMAAWAVWNQGKGFNDTTPPESRLPATRACFRGLADPFTWKPHLETRWLPAPDLPLALRLMRFISQWEAAAGSAP